MIFSLNLFARLDAYETSFVQWMQAQPAFYCFTHFLHGVRFLLSASANVVSTEFFPAQPELKWYFLPVGVMYTRDEASALSPEKEISDSSVWLFFAFSALSMLSADEFRFWAFADFPGRISLLYITSILVSLVHDESKTESMDNKINMRFNVLYQLL